MGTLRVLYRNTECGNAFSELNDPLDQRERFTMAQKDFQAGEDEAHPVDGFYHRARARHAANRRAGLWGRPDEMLTDQCPSARSFSSAIT